MNNLLDQLKRHEGFRSKPYRCTAKKLTIGYGRNLDDVGISKREAEKLLETDILTARLECEKLEWFPRLDAVRQDTITNLVFNIGMSRFLGFKKAIHAIKDQDFETAAKEMLDSKWARQVGKRAIELAEQMQTGRYSFLGG